MYNNKEMLRKSLNEVKMNKSLNQHMSMITQMQAMDYTYKDASSH